MRVFKKHFFILVICLFTVLGNVSFADDSKTSEFDILRGEMSYLKDKKSQEYIKSKQKLDRIISQQKINYTNEARFNDALRLIQEQKYNAAIYELNCLIDENYNVSRCYELLGDICTCSKKPVKTTVSYYKKALKFDNTNVSVLFKLSKIYLAENKNIMGLEYLSMLSNATDDYALLNQVESIILNTATPTNKYEANNFYETLANVQIKLGKREDSYRNYIKALQANPEDIFLKYYLAELFYEDNCTQDTVRMIDTILSQKKNDSQIRTTKAKALANSGNINSAYKEYIEILKQNPDSKQAKYGIYKLLEDKLSLPMILKKINFSDFSYTATKEECLKFAKFLDEFGDEGAQKYRNLAFQMEEEERRQIEYRREQELIRQQQLALEKQRQLEEKKRLEQEALLKQKQLEEAKLKAQKEAELKRQQLQKEAELKKQREYELQQEKLKKQKELEEAKLKAQKEAELKRKQAQKEAELKRQQAQKETELKRQQAQKEKQEKQEKLKKEAELRLQQEKLKQQKISEEKQKQLQEQKLKAQKLKEQKLKEEKEKALKLEQQRKEQAQREYEKRKIAQELQSFQTKNPKKYLEYNTTLNKYLKTEPKDAKTYLAIANTYKLMEAPSASLKYYKEAIKLNPTDSDLYYSLALSYMELDSFETAYYNLNKAIKLDPQNAKVKNLIPFVKHKLVTRYINDAYSKFEAKKYLEASDILNEGIKKFPDNAQLYYYRALSYDAMNRNAAAIIDLQKAVNLDSSLYMAFYQLGKSYEKIKDERSALVAYERFLSIEPDEKDLINEIQKKVVTLGQKYY